MSVLENVADLARIVGNDEAVSVERRDAIYKLGKLGEVAAPAVPVLLKLLDNDLYTMNVITTLEYIGKPAAPALPELKAVLRSSASDDQRIAIVAAVWKIDDDPTPALELLPTIPVATYPPALALGVKTAVEIDRPDLIPFVLRALKSASGEVRCVAADALGTLGKHDRVAALRGLEEALVDKDDDMVRYRAGANWLKLGGKAATVVPIFEDILVSRFFKVTYQDEAFIRQKGMPIPPEVQLDLITLLGAIGPAAAPALRTLEILGADPSLNSTVEKAISRIRLR